jgi:spermidine/putrescine transport system permease protein
MFLFLAIPFYVLLCTAFGSIDPLFRNPVPAWNPLDWRLTQVAVVFERLFGPDNFYLPPVMRTIGFVLIAVVISLLIAFPVAYFDLTRSAILDQLHDADAGLGEPIADRRHS